MDTNLPPSSAAATPKKKLPVLAWVGIGCGGLLVIVVIVAAVVGSLIGKKVKDFADNPERTAAEAFVKLNPDWEKVSSDDELGEMTIRDKEGKTLTISYAQLSEGNFEMRDDEGNSHSFSGPTTDLSKIPSWVPRFPQGAETMQVLHQVNDGETNGSWTFKTDATVDQVLSYYKDELKKAGFDELTHETIGDAPEQLIRDSYSLGEQTINVGIITDPEEDKMTVNIVYSEK